MKTLQITTAFLFLMILGITATQARDQYSRTVKREYNINPDAQLIVDNKFGKVHCENWDKNVIGIEVIITVDAANEEAASKIMDHITFTLSGTPDKVEARTLFDEGGIRKNSNMSIDYKISMPVTISLDLTNQFGDIFVNELNGKGRFNLAYGNMEVNKLNNGDNFLDIKFSKANIKSMKGAVVNLKYSDLQIEYAGSLRLDSKFSNLDAAKIIVLNVNFEGGKLNMENSQAVDSRSKFSDLNITRIDKSLNLDIQYGNCDIEEMPAEFSTINIINKYANVSVGLPSSANYSLEADLKFCDLDFPEDRTDYSQKIITNTSKSYRATVGKGATGSKVTIRSEFGNVSLQ